MTTIAPPWTRLLGNFLDRTLGVPFSKPQKFHNDGTFGIDRETIVTATEATVAQMVDWLRDANTRVTAGERVSDFHPLFLMADPAGPWWGELTRDFLDASATDRAEVIGRLPMAARDGARLLQNAAIEEKWRWLWSQPSMHAPSGAGVPTIERPDFLFGRHEAPTVGVIDVKARLGLPLQPDAVKWERQMANYVEVVERAGYSVGEAYFALVSTKGEGAGWMSAEQVAIISAS